MVIYMKANFLIMILMDKEFTLKNIKMNAKINFKDSGKMES